MVGILTFYWADDYGAMLQAYALKAYLKKQGEAVEIIPYAPLRLRGRYQFIPVNAVCRGGTWTFYRDFGTFCWKLRFFKQTFKRRTAMRSFRERYLTGKKPIEKAGEIRMEPYDVVFVGSDQVWNSNITFGLDDAYLGNLGKGERCRLSAYAASFGKDEPPEREWQEFKRALSENFAAVSLREKGAADFAGRLLGKPVADVLDPVLLLKKDAWEAVERKPREKEYILFYATEPQEDMLRFMEALSKASGRPVVCLSAPYKRKRKDGVLLRTGTGPEEFLGYFHHASCVITNSFHGLAFSILFEKQFLIFQHSAYHARLKSLLEKLSLESRLVEIGKRADLSRMDETINWPAVRECLRAERERSERFIKESLERL